MGLGDTWTDDVADAWNWVYRMMADAMVEAGEEEVKKQSQTRH